MPITPEYNEYILNTLKVHKELQESILRDIVRRMLKTDMTVPDTASWQAEKLQQCGILYNDIINEVSKRTDSVYYDILTAFNDAETEVFNYDNKLLTEAGFDPDKFKTLSPAMQSIWTAALAKTTTEAVNLTKTTALTAQNMYIEACDLAHMQVLSGAFSYTEAISNAIRSSAKQGVTVSYPSGHKSSLDVAIRRSVLTGVNQTAAKLQEMRVDEFGVDLVEVSAHYGARPDHAEWQGQVYSRSGATKGYDKFEDATGYGTLEGLCGVNCRHNFYPFFESISKRSYTDKQLEDMKNHTVEYNGKQLTDYEAKQLQRRFERNIRTTKQELVMYDEAKKNVTTDEEKALWQQEFNNSAVKLKGQEAKLKDFCKQTCFSVDNNRTQVFAFATENGIKNFGKSVSQKAVWLNKNSIDKSLKNSIIKAESASRYVNTSDQLFKNAKNIKPIDGFEDITIHGDKFGFEIRALDGKTAAVYSAIEFADILKEDPNYHGGNIRLISCESGADGAVVAQLLANQLGVNIMAPTDIVWVYPDGSMVIGPNEFENTGEWKIFNPKGV